MKKILITLAAAGALLGLLLLASGCGSSASADASKLTKEKYDQIEVGMSSDAIKKIAGEPSKTETKSMSGSHQMSGGSMSTNMSVEYWYYQGSKGWVRLDVGQGELLAKSGY